jgi:multidrug transporter EmrE-like cation transporter
MLLVNVVLGSFGQLFLKLGMMRSQKGPASVGSEAVMGAIRSIGNPQVLLGFMLYGVSSILWLIILKKVPLSKAYPMISLSYVVVVLLSSFILKEKIALSTIVGLVFICCGVALIGYGMAQVGGK